MKAQSSAGFKCGGFVAMVLLALLLYLPAQGVSESQETEPGGKTDRRSDIVITIVYDNYSFDKRLEPAWGFACVIDGLAKRILFDTGGHGERLLSNMAKLGIEPEQIDIVVLSHVHQDHTGGLAAFLHTNSNVKVFMPNVFPRNLKMLTRRVGATLVETTDPCPVCDGAWTTGVLDRGINEEGLYIKTSDGLIVITGCAHPGIVQMAAAAKKHAGVPVRAVLGGFHMGGASSREISDVITALRDLGVRQVAPTHCSGDLTRKMMRKAFPTGYLPAGVGARLVFNLDCAVGHE